MYEDTALYINRMKKKEDDAMQTGNLLAKTTPNCRFMTWLWCHYWHNHYNYNVIRATRSSTNLYLHYFFIKCNLFIKILKRGKNTKNMEFVQNISFQKCSGASNKIATAKLPRAAEPWKYLRICQIDINWKQKIWGWGGNFNPSNPQPNFHIIRNWAFFLSKLFSF